jgi:hypothetical protein
MTEKEREEKKQLEKLEEREEQEERERIQSRRPPPEGADVEEEEAEQ